MKTMKNNYKFFWGGMLCNWYFSNFTINNVTFNCGEQYMMYMKAICFGDEVTAKKIMSVKLPGEQKKLGREVKNFNPTIWDEVKYETVKNGLREKFTQNPDLKKYLLKFKGYQLCEASPHDRIWGIGFYDNDALNNIDKWGENLLGKILTELTEEL